MSALGALIYKIRCRTRESIIKTRFKRSLKKATPVIVYQMGKVGSSSIYDSLRKQYKGVVLHRHELEKSDWQGQMLIELAMKQHKPLKIISLTREPVGRNISAFFQNFELITGIKPENSTYSTAELQNIFLSSPVMDHTVPLKWFDDNILKHFGINIYSTPFPEKGWKIFRNGNTEVLVIKSEISDEVKTKVLSEFTGLNEFNLYAANVGESKDYGNMYSLFRKEMKLPASYIDMFYTSPFIKYFYSENELQEARKKW